MVLKTSADMTAFEEYHCAEDLAHQYVACKFLGGRCDEEVVSVYSPQTLSQIKLPGKVLLGSPIALTYVYNRHTFVDSEGSVSYVYICCGRERLSLI